MRALIIGGNRFFGRHLVTELLKENIEVTILNRGNGNNVFDEKVQYIKADRKNKSSLNDAVKNKFWDVVYDQVCYTAKEAREACEIFKSKTNRYFVTSSESVYDCGLNLREQKFSPKDFLFQNEIEVEENYQTAKRQMESIFAKTTNFNVCIVRPSLVVGIDDYTNRLSWHLNKIQKAQPIYFPSLDIQSDFIRSDQAAAALKIIGLSTYSGVINCTTPGSLKLRDFLSLCEKTVGKKANLASNHEEDNHSPYGGSADRTMDTETLRALGFFAPSSSDWMPELIQKIYDLNRSSNF